MIELIYMLREAAKAAPQNEVHISIKSLRDAIFKKLLDEDNVAIYPSEAELHEDLKVLQKLSFLNVDNGVVVINRNAFLDATSFVEKQLQLFKYDRYATAILEKLRQRAPQLLESASP